MMHTIGQYRSIACALLMVPGVGCSGDGPTGPRTGTIHVSVPTTGGDLDITGYYIAVSGLDWTPLVFANSTAYIRDVAAGQHTVTLAHVDENCAVLGEPTRSVTVKAGETVDVAFEVVCEATGIAVTTHTTGVDTPDTYQVVVSDRPPTPIVPNGSAVVGRLSPASYTVSLQIDAANCTVVGASEVTVEVSARRVTTVSFEVTCAPPIRLERIAYVITTFPANGLQQWIELVDPDGSGTVRLTEGHSPAWSPDGKRLLFSTTYCEPYYWYYYEPPCTGGLATIDPETHSLRPVVGGDGALSPAWAPSGDAIVYLRCCESWGGSATLHIAALDADSAVDLTPDVAEVADPVWSPDGQRLAFACIVEPAAYSVPPNWDLCAIDRDGTNFVRLTSDTTTDVTPAWSPDGTRIAFTQSGSQTAGGVRPWSTIAVLTLEGGAISQLTSGADPSWSRDGTLLVFNGFDGLYTVNADGSGRQRLTTGAHVAPTWRP